MWQQHNCPIQADAGEAGTVQNVFRKETKNTQYCGSVTGSYWEQPRMAEFPKFAHRSNLDGTTDSICFRCIATVATVYEERELLRYEQEHVCDPVLVKRFDSTKPPSSEAVEDSLNFRYSR